MAWHKQYLLACQRINLSTKYNVLRVRKSMLPSLCKLTCARCLHTSHSPWWWGFANSQQRKSVMTSRYPISIAFLCNSKMHASVLLWRVVLASSLVQCSIQSSGLLKALWHSSLADLFNWTPNHLIWEVLSHSENLKWICEDHRERYSYTTIYHLLPPGAHVA